MVYLTRERSYFVFLGLWLSRLGAAQSSTAPATPSSTCYRTVSNEIQQQGGPCGVVYLNTGPLSCCNPGDLCMSNGLCRYPQIPDTGSGYSGFYAAACTDETYKSPACNPYCTDLARADVVWNATLQKWLCCGVVDANDTVNCSRPTSEDFTLPSPDALIATFSVLPTPSIILSSSGFSSTVTVTSTSSAGTYQGVSSGAATGIGIGAAFGGIAITALAGFLLWRRPAATSRSPLERWADGTGNAVDNTAAAPLHEQYYPKEMPSETVPVELEPARNELPESWR